MANFSLEAMGHRIHVGMSRNPNTPILTTAKHLDTRLDSLGLKLASHEPRPQTRNPKP